MPLLLRRLVSGAKARHHDPELDIELDLVYLTPRIILMGFPSSGIEALYRNPIKQVVRFLDTKHAGHYRVYSLCPCNEGRMYHPSEFHGNVSRYPFPDHHAPPLSLMALFTADSVAYLTEDPRNVVVIHCKAGKGRTGTMACSLLLSMPSLVNGLVKPDAAHPILSQRVSANTLSSSSSSLPVRDGVQGVAASDGSHNASASDSQRAAKSLDARRTLSSTLQAPAARSTSYLVDDPRSSMEVSDEVSERLRQVFELHTSKRMKPRRALNPAQSEANGAEHTSTTKSLRRARSAREVLDVVFPKIRSSVEDFVAESPSPVREQRLGQQDLPIASKPGHTNDHHLPRKPSLGSRPAGRSTDELNTAGVNGLAASSSPARHWLDTVPAPQLVQQRSSSRSRTPSPDQHRSSTETGATANSKDSEGRLDGGSVRVKHLRSWAKLTRSDSDDQVARTSGAAISDMLNANPVMGVSIPSQRRFVGYHARCLAGRDARLAFSAGYGTASPISSSVSPPTSEPSDLMFEHTRSRRPSNSSVALSQPPVKSSKSKAQAATLSSSLPPAVAGIPRRVIRITKIVVERTSLPKGAPIRDALSLQLRRYNDAMVSRLETWECKARRRAIAFGAHDPGATAMNSKSFGAPDTGDEQTWKIPFNPASEVEQARNFDWQDVDSRPQSDNGMFELVGHVPRNGSVDRRADKAGHEVERHIFDFTTANAEDPAETASLPPKVSADTPSLTVIPPTPQSKEQFAPEELSAAAAPRLEVLDVSVPGNDGGLLVDADRELLIKVLIGRTGATHARLPDFLAACWTWMIPAFEEPRRLPDPAHEDSSEGADQYGRDAEDFEEISDEGYVSNEGIQSAKGQKQNEARSRHKAGKATISGKPTVLVGSATTVRFGQDELDFRKKALGIKAMEVSWEWVQV